MKCVLEISDRDESGALAVSFKDLLEALPPSIHDFRWRLYEFEVVGNGTLDVGELRRKIEFNVDGLLVNWDQLLSFSDSLLQPINIVLAGARKPQTLAFAPADSLFYEMNDIVIECIDGSLWRVTNGEPEVLNEISSQFKMCIRASI